MRKKTNTFARALAERRNAFPPAIVFSSTFCTTVPGSAWALAGGGNATKSVRSAKGMVRRLWVGMARG